MIIPNIWKKKSCSKPQISITIIFPLLLVYTLWKTCSKPPTSNQFRDFQQAPWLPDVDSPLLSAASWASGEALKNDRNDRDSKGRTSSKTDSVSSPHFSSFSPGNIIWKLLIIVFCWDDWVSVDKPLGYILSANLAHLGMTTSQCGERSHFLAIAEEQSWNLAMIVLLNIAVLGFQLQNLHGVCAAGTSGFVSLPAAQMPWDLPILWQCSWTNPHRRHLQSKFIPYLRICGLVWNACLKLHE